MTDKARAERLRVAVKKAGGNQAVANRAGLPVGTLNNYLAGRDMKVGAFIALAAACHVSLDWLATGFTSDQPDDARIPTEPRVITTGQSQSQTLSTVREHQESIAPPPPVDRGHLAQAIEIVKKLDGLKAFETPAVTGRIADAYDILIGAKP